MFKRTQRPFIRAKDAQQRECEAVAMMAYHNLCRSVVLHRTAGLPIPYADERAMAVIRGEDVGRVRRGGGVTHRATAGGRRSVGEPSGHGTVVRAGTRPLDPGILQ
jgi:hypothetical protein